MFEPLQCCVKKKLFDVGVDPRKTKSNTRIKFRLDSN